MLWEGGNEIMPDISFVKTKDELIQALLDLYSEAELARIMEYSSRIDEEIAELNAFHKQVKIKLNTLI